MTDFTDEYGKLLIKQYYDKPRASAEVAVITGSWGAIFDWLNEFNSKFDVDTAVGDQLAKIGKIVGMPKTRLPEGLTDEEYRFYVQLKILVNNTAGYMTNDEYPDIIGAIDFAFDGQAEVFDNGNMTLSLQISPSVDPDFFFLLRRLNLLPKPQGVGYEMLVVAGPDAFGFDNDPDALGFGDVFDPGVGGVFARLITEV